MKKESFVFYETWAEALRQLPDKERLQVFDAIINYGIYEKKATIGGLAQMALELIYNDIDDCKAKRREKIEKARESANKRWQNQNANECDTMRTHTNECERIRTDATQCYNVNVNVNGNVNDNVDSSSIIYSPKNENFDADKSATNKPQPKTIEERKNDFMKLVAENGIEKYGQEMCREFFDYWTESNPNGKKMRFEMQKVFDIKKRLATWNKNNFKNQKYGNQRIDGDIPTERIVAAGRAMAAAGL